MNKKISSIEIIQQKLSILLYGIILNNVVWKKTYIAFTGLETMIICALLILGSHFKDGHFDLVDTSNIKVYILMDQVDTVV
jgi:phosphoglycerol transferase MdoB-like AlkP superfamily enzyme